MTARQNPYERRITAKDKAAMSRWAQQSNRPPDGALDRTKLWASLHVFIRKHHAFITSPANTYPVRIEIPPDSDLPEKLRQFGYTIIDKGQETRIGGPATSGYGSYTVLVCELDLPRQLLESASKVIPVR